MSNFGDVNEMDSLYVYHLYLNGKQVLNSSASVVDLNQINKINGVIANVSSLQTTVSLLTPNLSGNVVSIEQILSHKVDDTELALSVAEITSNINQKLNITDFNSNLSVINGSINQKLNITDFNSNLSVINGSINQKLNITDFESNLTTINNSINGKANLNHNHTTANITNFNNEVKNIVNENGGGIWTYNDLTHMIEPNGELIQSTPLLSIGHIDSETITARNFNTKTDITDILYTIGDQLFTLGKAYYKGIAIKNTLKFAGMIYGAGIAADLVGDILNTLGPENDDDATNFLTYEPSFGRFLYSGKIIDDVEFVPTPLTGVPRIKKALLAFTTENTHTNQQSITLKNYSNFSVQANKWDFINGVVSKSTSDTLYNINGNLHFNGHILAKTSDVVKLNSGSEQTINSTLNVRKLRINSGDDSTNDGNSAYLTYDGTDARMFVNNSQVLSFRDNAIGFSASAGAYFNTNLIFSGDNQDVVIGKTGTNGKSLLLQAGDDGSSENHYIELIARNAGRATYTAMRVSGIDERIEINRDLYINGGVAIDFSSGTIPSITSNKLYYDGDLKFGNINISNLDNRIGELEANYYDKTQIDSLIGNIDTSASVFNGGTITSGLIIQDGTNTSKQIQLGFETNNNYFNTKNPIYFNYDGVNRISYANNVNIYGDFQINSGVLRIDGNNPFDNYYTKSQIDTNVDFWNKNGSFLTTNNSVAVNYDGVVADSNTALYVNGGDVNNQHFATFRNCKIKLKVENPGSGYDYGGIEFTDYQPSTAHRNNTLYYYQGNVFLGNTSLAYKDDLLNLSNYYNKFEIDARFLSSNVDMSEYVRVENLPLYTITYNSLTSNLVKTNTFLEFPIGGIQPSFAQLTQMGTTHNRIYVNTSNELVYNGQKVAVLYDLINLTPANIVFTGNDSQITAPSTLSINADDLRIFGSGGNGTGVRSSFNNSDNCWYHATTHYFASGLRIGAGAGNYGEIRINPSNTSQIQYSALNSHRFGQPVYFDGDIIIDSGTTDSYVESNKLIIGKWQIQQTIRPYDDYQQLFFRYDGTDKFCIRRNGGFTLSNYTHYHKIFTDDSLTTNDIGKIVEMTGNLRNMGNVDKSINEALPLVKICDKYKSKKVFGVISSINDKIIKEDGTQEIEYENGYIQQLAEVDKTKTIIRVNTSGDGIVKVVFRINENIEAGDYITTYRQGYGIRQDDDLNHNYTIAKATEDILYSSLTEEVLIDGIIYKSVKLGCIYLS